MIDLILNIHSSDKIDSLTLTQYYQHDELSLIIITTLTYMLTKFPEVDFTYFSDLTVEDWQKPIELDIYITDLEEGRQLNFDSRSKDYATNILSYPSDLPTDILTLLPSIPLGELVICHKVVETQANEQKKSVVNHLSHLLVHGTLHLLGFDHELGESERVQMESFEIDILNQLNIHNPYE